MAVFVGEAVVEENTSKAYAGPSAAPLSGQLAAANGTGSALFVINLCTSMAPVPLAGKSLPGLDSYRLYQVSRVEDGRTRYRLRLGFFSSEADAKHVLSSVREKYPTAFAACLGDEDRRFARNFLPDASLSDTQIQKRTVALLVDSPKAPAASASSAPPAAVTQPKAATTTGVPSVAAKPATPAAAAKRAVQPPTAVKPTPTPVAAKAAQRPVATNNPAAPAVASPSQVAARSSIDDVTEIELSWETGLAAPSKIQAAARPADARQAPAAPIDDASEIELSWDLPALSVAPGEQTTAAPITIPARFATEPVIKARPEPKAVEPKSGAKAPQAKAPVPAAKAAKSASDREPMVRTTAPTAIELTLAAESAAAPQPSARSTPATPFHVGKGVSIPAVSFSLVAEEQAPAVAAKAPVAAATVAKKEPVASKPAVKAATKAPPKREPAKPTASMPVAASTSTRVASKTAATTQAPAAASVAQAPAGSTPPMRRIGHSPAITAPGSVPELDSTQTIRALTRDELNDAAQEKWFAIQLAVSEQPVNLDAMPRLDIFEAYRVYSVASAGSGKIVHSLRLGFFREAVSADAVGGYLKTFFPNPSVLRISAAEQLRFKDPPAPKASPEAKNESKVIDLSDARQRAAKPVVPTVTMEVATPRPVSDRSPTGMHKISTSGSYKFSATDAHKLGATGSHKLNASGTHQLSSNGPHKLGSTGTHKTLRSAARSSGPATRQSPAGKHSKASNSTGSFRAVAKKSLTDQLLDEAREVDLAASGIHKLPQNNSLLSRLVDKLKK